LQFQNESANLYQIVREAHVVKRVRAPAQWEPLWYFNHRFRKDAACSSFAARLLRRTDLGMGK